MSATELYPEHSRTLYVSDTIAGFVRSEQVAQLRDYAALVAFRGGHHLGNVLRDMAETLAAGAAVRVTYGEHRR